ncbi:MAG: hypothetical protein LBB23_00120 [Rickettsiales bacterium]|nr:hypothetical protein [Rickettsiales bacterium]
MEGNFYYHYPACFAGTPSPAKGTLSLAIPPAKGTFYKFIRRPIRKK